MRSSSGLVVLLSLATRAGVHAVTITGVTKEYAEDSYRVNIRWTPVTGCTITYETYVTTSKCGTGNGADDQTTEPSSRLPVGLVAIERLRSSCLPLQGPTAKAWACGSSPMRSGNIRSEREMRQHEDIASRKFCFSLVN